MTKGQLVQRLREVIKELQETEVDSESLEVLESYITDIEQELEFA